MSNGWKSYAVAACLLPVAALADINSTATLNAGSNFSLDTGTVVSSGGDITFNGTQLAYAGTAAGGSLASLGISGAAGFSQLTQSTLVLLAPYASTTPIPLASLSVNTIVAVATNGGNAAKLLITASSGASISFQYTTYGATASGGGTPPTITEVQNNYSYIVPGLPNYGIAPGSLFIIKGTNMASTTTVTSLESSAAPGIPMTLNGASISVTVGGVTTTPAMYYAEATQIAAVLPSGTPTGTGTITVTYNNQPSNALSITVVPTALGLDTYLGSGVGLATATDLNYSVFNYNKSASPGQNIILWGSGLGADAADSDTTVTATPHPISVPLTIYIGGIQANIIYQGSSGYPGLNQIDVTIPPGVAPGCAVSVVAVSGSVVSNIVTLPITAVAGGVCSDPILGYDGNQILTLGGKSNYNAGALLLFNTDQSGTIQAAAIGEFKVDAGSQSQSGSGLASLGSCIVTSSVVATGTPPAINGLDAGTITVQGPSGSQALTEEMKGSYGAELASGFVPAAGGSFTFTGTGGADVGPISTTVSYSNPMTWTNMSSITSVTRANGVNLTWSGGPANTYVYISGTSSSSSVTASFTCNASIAAGQFTVPSYILLALPAGSGTLGIENSTTPQSFTASGLDSGVIFAGVSYGIKPTYN